MSLLPCCSLRLTSNHYIVLYVIWIFKNSSTLPKVLGGSVMTKGSCKGVDCVEKATFLQYDMFFISMLNFLDVTNNQGASDLFSWANGFVAEGAQVDDNPVAIVNISILIFPFAVQHDIVRLQILDLSFQRKAPGFAKVSNPKKTKNHTEWEFLASCESTHPIRSYNFPNATKTRCGAFQNLWGSEFSQQRFYPFWVDLMTSRPFQTVPCLLDDDFHGNVQEKKGVHWKITILGKPNYLVVSGESFTCIITTTILCSGLGLLGI